MKKWIGVLGICCGLATTAAGDQVITNITFGTGDNTGTGMSAKDAGVAINTNFFLVVSMINASSNALVVLIGDRATWGSISNLQQQLNGLVAANTNGGISAETGTNIADALDRVLTNAFYALLAGKQGTNANLDGWAGVGTNLYARLVQLQAATNVQSHTDFQYSQGQSYYVLLWDPESASFAECPDLYVTDDGYLYTTGIWGYGGGLTSLDAGQLSTGYVPLGRLANISSNQIAAATDAVYRQDLVGHYITVSTNLTISTNNGVVTLGGVPRTNVVVVGGTGATVSTSWVDGVTTYTVNVAASDYWDSATTLLVHPVAPDNLTTNVWTGTIATGTTVYIESDTVVIGGHGEAGESRFSVRRGTTIYRNASGTTVDGGYSYTSGNSSSFANAEEISPSNGNIAIRVTIGSIDDDFRIHCRVKTTVVSNP